MAISASAIVPSNSLEEFRIEFNNLVTDVSGIASGTGFGASIIFEGATADEYETTLTVVDPTADRTITIPNETGTLVTTNTTSSTTVVGIVELATDAETVTGTDTARAITPANLQAMTASATRDGIVELATDAETITGTDTGRAITPANLQAMTATTARDGIVELATDAETVTGTDTDRAVTPAGLHAGLAGLTDTVITASDTVIFADATDSDALKEDTVQGILDLAGAGDLLASNNLSDVSNASTSLSNLGGAGLGIVLALG